MNDYPTTFAEASGIGAYELARQWANLPQLSGDATALNELAIMAALADWLERWLPTQINRAALDGCTLEQIVAATDSTPTQVRDAWTGWAAEQRALYDREPDGEHRIGLSPERYVRVAAVLGVTKPGQVDAHSEEPALSYKTAGSVASWFVDDGRTRVSLELVTALPTLPGSLPRTTDCYGAVWVITGLFTCRRDPSLGDVSRCMRLGEPASCDALTSGARDRFLADLGDSWTRDGLHTALLRLLPEDRSRASGHAPVGEADRAGTSSAAGVPAATGTPALDPFAVPPPIRTVRFARGGAL